MNNFLTRPDKIFLVLGLLFSLAYLFVTPPLRGPDEPAHFKRLYQLAYGNVFGGWQSATQSLSDFREQASERNGRLLRGDETARYTVADIQTLMAMPLEKDRLRQENLAGSSSAYTPVPYLGAIPGLWISEQIGFPPIVVMWTARLGSLLAGLFGVWAVMRFFPAFAWPLALVALMPMTNFLRGVVSADTLTTVLAWAYAALVATKVTGEKQLTWRDVAPLAALAWALALSKTAYVPLTALAMMISPVRFGGMRRYIGAIGAIVVPSIVMALYWALWVKGHFYNLHSPEPVRGSWPSGQLEFILTEPVAYLGILRDTIFSTHFTWDIGMREFVGSLCYQDRPVPAFFAPVYLVFGLMLALAMPKLALTPGKRAWALAMAGLGVVGALTLLYLQWTGYRAPLVEGFQGRYLLPLVPFVLLAIPGGRLTLPPWLPGAGVVLLTVLANAAGLWAIVEGDYR